MNQVQKLYMEAKAMYEDALENKDKDLISKLEPYKEAETALIDWALDRNVKRGFISDDDATFIRKHIGSEQRMFLVDKALRYDVTICPKCISEHYGTFTKCENCGYTES